MTTAFATPVDNTTLTGGLPPTLKVAYTHGVSTTITVSGYFRFLPSVSVGSPLRFTVIQKDAVGSNGVITDKTRLSIFKATSLTDSSGDAVLGGAGVVTAELNHTVDFAAGDYWQILWTAEAVNDIHTAINTLESGAPYQSAFGVQNANKVYAGPTVAPDATPTFRALIGADLPLFGMLATGAVPQSGGGTTNFLRADGNWAAPAGSGTMAIGSAVGSGTANCILYEDGSANLANSASLTTDGTTIVAGGYYLGSSACPLAIELTRNLGGTKGDYVEIGSFSSTHNNCVFARISVFFDGGGGGVATHYILGGVYGTAPSWQEVQPSHAIRYANNDISLDIQGYTVRLRANGNTGSVTCTVRVESFGTIGGSTFTPSSGSGSGATVVTDPLILSNFGGPGSIASPGNSVIHSFYRPNGGNGIYPQAMAVKLGRYSSGGGATPKTLGVFALKSLSSDDIVCDLELLGLSANGIVESYGHLITSGGDIGGSAPVTIAQGTGAGTGPTVSIAGSDQDGSITVVTGSAPATASVIATITFGIPFAVAPRSVVLTEGNAVTAALSGTGRPFVNGITTAVWTLVANSVALAPTTTYLWYYRVGG